MSTELPANLRTFQFLHREISVSFSTYCALVILYQMYFSQTDMMNGLKSEVAHSFSSTSPIVPVSDVCLSVTSALKRKDKTLKMVSGDRLDSHFYQKAVVNH